MIVFEKLAQALYPAEFERVYREFTYELYENGVEIPERLREQLELDMTVDGIDHNDWCDEIHAYLYRELEMSPGEWYVTREPVAA